MVNYEYEDLFYESAYRNLTIMYDDSSQIDNDNIGFESMEIKESITTSDQLKFGEVCASEFSIKLLSEDSFIGKRLDVFMTMNENEDTRINIGQYYVHSDAPTNDKTYKEIKAYDKLYDVIKTDVASWYNRIVFPITLKQMRDSFCEHLGITQEDTELINDDLLIEQTVSPQVMMGVDILQPLCELNGVFPHMNREGVLVYIRLPQNYDNVKELRMFYQGQGAYQDYVTQPISKVEIKQSDEDVGIEVGTDGNCYKVISNILTYGKSPEQQRDIATKLLSVIQGVSYRPFSVQTRGNLCWEVGDAIKINTNNDTYINSIILERNLSGIQGLQDTFNAEGNELYIEDANSVKSSIITLKRTTNTLIRDNEKTQSIISNLSVGGKNLINDSELLQGLVAIEPIRDENGVWLTDSNNIQIYD